jgi:serine/threonine protein kinase
MTADQQQEARILFDRALREAPDRRAAFLAATPGIDEEIRREVGSLLAAYEAAAGFLETPAWRVADDAPSALRSGDRIGHLTVIELLGRGGMGEVYRARDARLERDVAIKVLPRALADDPDRLVRFERESRVLASLSHPHIAAIYSIEQAGPLRVLVMELVEGPTLAERLQTGALPQDEALAIARELAGALEATHERGLVHRDLKPANIKLTASTGSKLLDFGLAKDVHAGAGHDTTTDGVILGTCAYMSPEQVRGKSVDRRADIWAFGCVLFEMLTGTRAFAGETASDTMAAVLDREPDWTRLPPATSPAVRRLLRRCLEKDAGARLHDIADARIEVDDARSNRDQAPSPTPRKYPATIAAVLAVAVGAAGVGWWLHAATGNRPGSPRLRFTWSLPRGLGLDSPPVVSPDGQRIAFTARPSAHEPSGLYLRALDQLEAQVVPGTEGAKQPFWSPDSRSLAYFARGKLMRVALDGGAPVEICAAPDARGGTWSTSGVIVFSPLMIESGLMKVPASGGAVEPATLLDAAQGENSHRWPVFLPDAIHFVYFVRALGEDRRGVFVGRIDRPASTPGTPLFRSEAEALYAPLDEAGGVLLTVAGGRVEARPFDARRRVLTGDPKTIDLPSTGNTLYHAMMLSVAGDVLAYGSTPIPYGVRLAATGRHGEDPAPARERGSDNWPRISPDDTRLAYSRIDPTPGRTDVWVEDVARGVRIRVSQSALAVVPVWSPDGERLAYVADSIQTGVLTISAADGTRTMGTVPCPGQQCEPSDWSLDGRWILATVVRDADQDVWLLPADGRGAPRALLAQPFPERDARLSPDGRLVAYVSLETGRPEVSVQTVDGTRRRDVISVAGGSQPVWRRDGQELFFVDPEGALRAAPVSLDVDGRPRFGSAVRLAVPPIGTGHWGTQYDITRDGRRIYFLDRTIETAPAEFGVVVGWRGLLR